MIIIEGADGTGKTTLGQALAEELLGQYFHCSYQKHWDIYNYHRVLLEAAGKLETGANITCIIDRWAVSEAVYGTHFRKEPSYPWRDLMNYALKQYNPTVVYCRTKDTVERHQDLIHTRTEMYDNIDGIPELYDDFIIGNKCYVYDFTKTSLQEAVSEIAQHERHGKHEYNSGCICTTSKVWV